MIKVLIVDDSAVVRSFLKDVFSSEKDIVVVGTAPDPFVARDKILRYNPDVMMLDIEMPRMDGITFLKKIMAYHPIPVIILSSLTQRGASTTIEALEEGAVEVIAKPQMDIIKGMEAITAEILEKVRIVASARVKKRAPRKIAEPAPIGERKLVSYALKKSTDKIIAIGASTGGTEAIKDVLIELPADTPGMLIVQHMPQNFTKAFAERLDATCAMEVREAVDGDAVTPGTALIAPGNQHMVLRRSGARYHVRLNQDAQVFYQRPSVEVLFESVAQYAGANAIGVILTGMGADGSTGLLRMREAGARTIAQDEESCIVFGMPKEAIRLGGAEKIMSLHDIPGALLSLI